MIIIIMSIMKTCKLEDNSSSLAFPNTILSANHVITWAPLIWRHTAEESLRNQIATLQRKSIIIIQKLQKSCTTFQYSTLLPNMEETVLISLLQADY